MTDVGKFQQMETELAFRAGIELELFRFETMWPGFVGLSAAEVERRENLANNPYLASEPQK